MVDSNKPKRNLLASIRKTDKPDTNIHNRFQVNKDKFRAPLRFSITLCVLGFSKICAVHYIVLCTVVCLMDELGMEFCVFGL